MVKKASTPFVAPSVVSYSPKGSSILVDIQFSLLVSFKVKLNVAKIEDAPDPGGKREDGQR